MSHEVPPFSSTRLTAQLGLLLSIMLGVMFASGGFFYLYVFNYDAPPWFTPVRFAHFYVGIASIPILLGKYGTTGLRFAGYYTHVRRFKAAGPPAFLPRVLAPLLAADFFVLYFSGLYMLFHYYYAVTNIWPFEAKPVQVHLWAAIAGVPLVTLHLGSHLAAALRSARSRATEPPSAVQAFAETRAGRLTRRGAFAMLAGSGVAAALLLQNTPLRSKKLGNLFIGRIPEEEKGGPGDFPVETLFGKASIDRAAYRLEIAGFVDAPMQLTYDEILALPSVEAPIRLSCVSGWTEVPRWRGPRVQDVLALAGERAGSKSVTFHSASGYQFRWHRRRLNVDRAILATHVNGAPLSENHGFPVRLIVPGYPGQNMVKQIDRMFVHPDSPRFETDYRLVRAESNRQLDRRDSHGAGRHTATRSPFGIPSAAPAARSTDMEPGDGHGA